MKTEILHMRISKHDKDALEILAKSQEMTVSELVTVLIRQEIRKATDVEPVRSKASDL